VWEKRQTQRKITGIALQAQRVMGNERLVDGPIFGCHITFFSQLEWSNVRGK
jgi:hypothetical protein